MRTDIPPQETGNRIDSLEPVFVEFMPDQLEAGKLYISHTYGTAIHLCACGCGHRTVTPTQPYWDFGWQLIEEDNSTISLWPSIGNFSLPCKSHYFVTQNKIVWT